MSANKRNLSKTYSLQELQKISTVTNQSRLQRPKGIAVKDKPNDCSNNENCIWKGRYTAISQECEYVKHQYKEQCSKEAATHSALLSEKMSLQAQVTGQASVLRKLYRERHQLLERVKQLEAQQTRQAHSLGNPGLISAFTNDPSLAPGFVQQNVKAQQDILAQQYLLKPRGGSTGNQAVRGVNALNQQVGSNIGGSTMPFSPDGRSVGSSSAIPATDVEDQPSPKLPKPMVSDFNPAYNSSSHLDDTPSQTNGTPATPTDTSEVRLTTPGTTPNILIESREEASNNGETFENRDSNFSLSNVCEYDDGRVRPLSGKMRDDGSAGDPASLNSKGTNKVDNPFQADQCAGIRLTSQSSEKNDLLSQTMKAGTSHFFKDEHIKDTPSFQDVQAGLLRLSAVPSQLMEGKTGSHGQGQDQLDSSNEDEGDDENASIGRDVEKTVMEIQNSPAPGNRSRPSSRAFRKSQTSPQAITPVIGTRPFMTRADSDVPVPPNQIAQQQSSSSKKLRQALPGSYSADQVHSFQVQEQPRKQGFTSATDDPEHMRLLGIPNNCDSDEIEVRDEDEDDCEFSSLEGKEQNVKTKQLPKIQKKFNQTVDQLNQMQQQNKLQRKQTELISAVKERHAQQLYQITEEASEMTTIVDQMSSMRIREGHILSPDIQGTASSAEKQRKRTLPGMTSTLGSQQIRDEINVSINQHSQPTPTNEDDINVRSSPSSTMSRDEEALMGEHLESADHFERAETSDQEEAAAQQEPQGTTSSVVHFDARFSTLESGRDNSKFKFNNRSKQEDPIIPKSQSQYPPLGSAPMQGPDGPIQPEFRPSTQITQNKHENAGKPEIKNASFVSIPPNPELGNTMNSQIGSEVTGITPPQSVEAGDRPAQGGPSGKAKRPSKLGDLGAPNAGIADNFQSPQTSPVRVEEIEVDMARGTNFDEFNSSRGNSRPEDHRNLMTFGDNRSPSGSQVRLATHSSRGEEEQFEVQRRTAVNELAQSDIGEKDGESEKDGEDGPYEELENEVMSQEPDFFSYLPVHDDDEQMYGEKKHRKNTRKADQIVNMASPRQRGPNSAFEKKGKGQYGKDSMLKNGLKKQKTGSAAERAQRDRELHHSDPTKSITLKVSQARKGTISGNAFAAPSSIISQGSSIFRTSFVNIGGGSGFQNVQRTAVDMGSFNARYSNQPFKDEAAVSFRARDRLGSVRNSIKRNDSLAAIIPNEALNESNIDIAPVYNPKVTEQTQQTMLKIASNNFLNFRRSQEQWSQHQMHSKTIKPSHSKNLPQPKPLKGASSITSPSRLQPVTSIPAEEKAKINIPTVPSKGGMRPRGESKKMPKNIFNSQKRKMSPNNLRASAISIDASPVADERAGKGGFSFATARSPTAAQEVEPHAIQFNSTTPVGQNRKQAYFDKTQNPVAENQGWLGQSREYVSMGYEMLRKSKDSPNVAKYQQSFTDYLGQQIEKFGFVSDRLLTQVKKKMIAWELHSAEMGDDLKWLSEQIEMSYLQSPFFFESYLVVGAKQETLELTEQKESFTSQTNERLQPSILYPADTSASPGRNFSQGADLVDQGLLEVISDFCFPNGVLSRKLRYEKGKDLYDPSQSEETVETVQKILYMQPTLRENMFVFSLDASEKLYETNHGQDLAGFWGDCHLYCLCYMFFDLEEVLGELYVVEKAICVVTVSPQYLPLLQAMITQNVKMLNEERQIKMNHLLTIQTSMSPPETFSTEIQSSLLVRYEEPPRPVQFLLESVRTYKLSHHDEQYCGGEFSKVSLKGPKSDEIMLQYEFPRSIRLLEAICEKNPMMPPVQLEDMQYDLIEHHWHIPVLFSLFGAKTFCKLLTAVLLERSIVFVHRNPAVVSSVILALKTLIRPFQWCHSLIPLLPRSILQHIVTPLPVLGGINNDDYDRLRDETSEQERKMKTWVFLEPGVARVQAEEPEYAPYKNANQEFDQVSGISIVWGSMDQDFSIDFRNEILMGWLADLEDRVEPQFEKYRSYSRKRDTANSQSLPGARSNHDDFPGEQVTDQSIFEFEKQQTPQMAGWDELDLPDNRMSLGDRASQRALSHFNKRRQNSMASPGFQEAVNLNNNNLKSAQTSVMNEGSDAVAKSYEESKEGTISTQMPAQLQKQSTSLQSRNTAEQVANDENLITEMSDKPPDLEDFTPIVLVPTEGQKQCIDLVVLEIATTLKEKILDQVEPLCEQCGITEPDEVLDSMMIAEELSNLAADSRDKDFLSKFAYTQTFAFMIQRYITEKNEGEVTETDGLDTDRDSPLKLHKHDSVISAKQEDSKPTQSVLRSTMAESPTKQAPGEATKPARIASQIVIQNMDTVGNDDSPSPRPGRLSQFNSEANQEDSIDTQPQEKSVEPRAGNIEASSARSSVQSNPSQAQEQSNTLKKETEGIRKMRPQGSKTLDRMETPDNPYTGAHPRNPYVREEDSSTQ